MKDAKTPFASTNARGITFEFYDPDYAPALFTAPRDLTIADCARRLTDGVGYSDGPNHSEDKVVYSIPSTRAPSPTSSPVVNSRSLSPTESRLSTTEFEDLADQLDQMSMTGKSYHYQTLTDVKCYTIGLGSAPDPDLSSLTLGLTAEAMTTWYAVYKGFEVGVYQGW